MTAFLLLSLSETVAQTPALAGLKLASLCELQARTVRAYQGEVARHVRAK